MAAAADKSKPYIPLAGGADDGWSKEDQATATCYCGAVQLAFVRIPRTGTVTRRELETYHPDIRTRLFLYTYQAR
jgi:hypothetical protein